MSDFAFVTDAVLRSNIDRVHELILELVLLSDSEGYRERHSLVNGIRKTIIIYVASIVEAMLLWKIKQKSSTNEIEIDDEWEYKSPKLIHRLTEPDGTEIIWCQRKKVKKSISRLDFLHIIRLCESHRILSGEKLIEDVHKIRELRNTLHIGNLNDIDREYKPEDLESCFSVLERVKSKLVD